MQLLEASQYLLSFMGTCVIVLFALRTVYLLARDLVTRSLNVSRLRLELGYGIILALEFMVGADIVHSIIDPTYYNIGILLCLVLIRTFLSYFLGRELNEIQASMKSEKKV